jgi:hypothetical protein
VKREGRREFEGGNQQKNLSPHLEKKEMLKMWFQNYTTVLNRKESFSIKEFMEEGRGLHKTVETEQHKTVQPASPILDSPVSQKSLTAYSIVFNPLMLFDPTFFFIGAGVVLVAVLEKQLANNGFVFIAESISLILGIAFPIVAVGSMIYLLSQLSFVL